MRAAPAGGTRRQLLNRYASLTGGRAARTVLVRKYFFTLVESSAIASAWWMVHTRLGERRHARLHLHPLRRFLSRYHRRRRMGHQRLKPDRRLLPERQRRSWLSL